MTARPFVTVAENLTPGWTTDSEPPKTCFFTMKNLLSRAQGIMGIVAVRDVQSQS
jgi:hypothetical protein